jgi:transposase InsO family protein
MAEKRTRRRFTAECKAEAVNRLDRHFAADQPDTVWLADISYLPTDEGWLYLAVVEDLATREVVGWSRADHLRAGLCIDAFFASLRKEHVHRTRFRTRAEARAAVFE